MDAPVMLNRRLWILFFAFLAVIGVIMLKLGSLQLGQSEDWRSKLQQFIHRQSVLDSYRGSILDRNGVVVAQDVPSDELAIDYRAMNLDDAWLRKRARDRMIESGEMATLKERSAREARITQVKREIADQIDAIPLAIGRVLAPIEGRPASVITEEILQRQEDIRKRIHAMRQDVWLRRFDRDEVVTASSTGEPADDDTALDALYQKMRLEDELASHTLLASLPRPAATYFKEHLGEYPGLSVRDQAARNRREYPLGEATAHVVGTLRSLDAATHKRRPFNMPDLLKSEDPGDLGGYLPGDRMGEVGIEQIAEEALRGKRGLRLLDLSATGGQERDPRSIDPVPGGNVKLTIDAALQRDLYEALRDPAKSLLKGEDGKEHPVACVIMALDGQLLAVISYPSYDPNKIDQLRGALNKDVANRPLRNRATSESYHPGSTVKPLLAIAGLAERVITANETIHCSGHYYATRNDIFRCTSSHGDVNLEEAIEHSCDVYFYTVGERLGLQRLTAWYDRFGFGRDTLMELPDADGHLPDAAKVDPDQLKNEAMFMGIGQGLIDTTPLQMANAYATLLRRGVEVSPRVLADTPVSQERRMEISAEALAAARQGMEAVTTTGTAKAHFRNMRLKVAGKTGTAEAERRVYDEEGRPIFDLTKPKIIKNGKEEYRQVVERHDDAWFVGYAPADAPRYVVAAIMEWGGHGGDRAAPIAKEAFLQLQRHGYLPKTDVP